MTKLKALLEEALAKHGADTLEQRNRDYDAARRGVAKYSDPAREAKLEQEIAEIEAGYHEAAPAESLDPASETVRLNERSAPSSGGNRVGRGPVAAIALALLLVLAGAAYIYRGNLTGGSGAAYDASFDKGLEDFSPTRAIKDGKVPAFPASVVAKTDEALSIVELTGENALFTRATIPVDPSAAYVLRARFRATRDDPASRGGAETYLGIVPYDKSGSEISLGAAGGYRYIASAPAHLKSSGGWTTVEGDFSGTGDTAGRFPQETAFVRPLLITNFGSQTSVTQVDYLAFQRK